MNRKEWGKNKREARSSLTESVLRRHTRCREDAKKRKENGLLKREWLEGHEGVAKFLEKEYLPLQAKGGAATDRTIKGKGDCHETREGRIWHIQRQKLDDEQREEDYV